MKKLFYFLFILLFVISFSSQTNAQVTNLTVNGSSTSFTMISGDNISWSYNLSTGGTSIVEIWVDVNTNATIDPSTDIRMFYFTIIDGNPSGINGPGDMDGATNGAISVGPIGVGLAPASYIMKFTENNVGQTITGTVTRLVSPAYTISGKVTPPTGANAGNVIIEMNRSDQIPGVMFWNAITDVNGDFTVEITSDTAGPWTLEISSEQNPFPSAIITPNRYDFFISTNITGKDFVVTKADAKVAGTLKFEDGSPAIGAEVFLFDLTTNGGGIGTFRHQVTVINNDGSFQIGLPSSELNGQKWVLESDLSQSDTTENYMDARYEITSINVSDSLYRNLVFYQVDATITGTISFQTGAPLGGNNANIAQITLIAMTDSTQSVVHNNTTTGNYTLRVSSKLPSYKVFGINLPQGYDQITLQNIAPGATNVNFNYLLTDVKERTSGIPESYSLSQNYPNPFNPSTNINYDIPNSSFVNITIYNELGQKVITLVNKEQKGGKYVVSFNASNLSSGVYFYQLRANNFVQIKKMILLK